jgi:PAS domain S-box-containing protein
VAEAMRGKANSGEYRVISKDGEVRWLYIRRHPIWDEQEERIVRFLGVAQDVTERRLAEDAERDQRLLAEALRHTAAAVNSTLNLDEVLDRILSQVASVMPHDSSTVMLIESGIAQVARCRGYAERGLEEAVLSARLPLARTRNLQRMFETQHPFPIPDTREYPHWMLAPETEWIRSQIAAPILVEGQVIGFVSLNSATPGVFADVHGFRLQAFADQAAIALQNARLYEAVRRHANELELHVAERTAELERERAQLQTILDGMGEGVTGILVDENLQVQRRYINQAMFRLLGATAEEFDPRRHQSAQMDQDEVTKNVEMIDQIVLERGLWQGEVRLRHQNGNEFDAALTVTRVDGTDGRVIGMVTIIRDISQEKALQDQRARFVAHASHELRTPITNLKTRLYLMRKQPEKIDEHLTVVEQVTERMKKLVEDLLDLSRLERGAIPLRREELNLSSLIAEVIRVQQPEAERKHIHLASDLPSTPLNILADQERITQVITNLVTNAINYTPEGGAIRVYASAEMTNGADYAVLHVQDSGVGIASDHLPHIFQPFYRVGDRAGGTGLGLSITREIVEMHGGHIQVESEVGHGTHFSLRFALGETER